MSQVTPSPDAHRSRTAAETKPLARLLRPVERFLHTESASGVILLAAAAVALAWANSPWASAYFGFWHWSLGVHWGALDFERPLEWFVNDGLMVIFFFVVGMEIRREVHHGELSDWRRAALPAAAALGGMVAPAGLYLVFAGARATHSGWGVPMATDIAFAVGLLALLGKRVPPALRVLLLALAVIDDLGAILVIAMFYTASIKLSGLLVAALGFAAILALQRLRVRSKLAYIPPALLAWAGVYATGIHPTIAGVIVGLMTPVVSFDASASEGADRNAQSPSETLIASLHPWVAFAIMPLFALANAGVVVAGGVDTRDAQLVMLGVIVALVLGKPIGVMAACWLTLRTGLGKLPKGVTVRHLIVLGCVAGVGFTMSLFIAQLAFNDAKLLGAAKLGVLLASAAAGVLALLLGRQLLSPAATPGAAGSEFEAEGSTEV